MNDKFYSDFVLKPSKTTSCGEKTNLYFLVIVHSKPAHFKRRQIIRETWGSVDQIHGHKIEVLFLLGKFPSAHSNVQSLNNSEPSTNQGVTVQEPKSLKFDFDVKKTINNRFSDMNDLKKNGYQSIKSKVNRRNFSYRLGKQSTGLQEAQHLKNYDDTSIIDVSQSQTRQKMSQRNQQKLQQDIVNEHLRFDDIIQGNFADNGENSIEKHLAGFKVSCKEQYFNNILQV